MNIFLAGASGVIGRRLAVLLRNAHYDVIGTTRTRPKMAALAALGIRPALVDVFDAGALKRVVESAAPDVIVHQLTDLPAAPGTPRYAEGQARNARLRVEGTRNLMDAAKAAGVTRVIAQSIAFVYAPGDGVRSEDDPLDVLAEGARKQTVAGVIALENAVLNTPGIDGIVLRYGALYGPGTWYAERDRLPALHIDAAAQAALLAVQKGKPGIYNIAEDEGGVSVEKATRELGFDSGFRIVA